MAVYLARPLHRANISDGQKLVASKTWQSGIIPRQCQYIQGSRSSVQYLVQRTGMLVTSNGEDEYLSLAFDAERADIQNDTRQFAMLGVYNCMGTEIES